MHYFQHYVESRDYLWNIVLLILTSNNTTTNTKYSAQQEHALEFPNVLQSKDGTITSIIMLPPLCKNSMCKVYYNLRFRPWFNGLSSPLLPHFRTTTKAKMKMIMWADTWTDKTYMPRWIPLFLNWYNISPPQASSHIFYNHPRKPLQITTTIHSHHGPLL